MRLLAQFACVSYVTKKVYLKLRKLVDFIDSEVNLVKLVPNTSTSNL